MNELVSLAGIIAALTLGTVSPGPSFVVVARIAVASSRENGVTAAFGMGVGSLVFAVAALLGLQGVLVAVPSLYLALKVLGGLYLCYLGFRIIWTAKHPIDTSLENGRANLSPSRSFLIGLGTQISNPKTAIVYASVFAAFLPAAISPLLGLAVLVIVFVIESSWYSFVALALSSRGPRRAYLGYKTWIDRASGAAIGALGARLIFSVRDN